MRLLRAIVLYDGTGDQPANNALRITKSGPTPVVVTLAASASGTQYFASNDGTSSDFFKALADAFDTATLDLTVLLPGVTQAGIVGTAIGRVGYLISPAIVSLDLEHASTTLPEGVLGWGPISVLDADLGDYSPSPHRFGFYPPLRPNFAIEDGDRVWGRFARKRGTTDKTGRVWGRYAVRRFQWDQGMPACYVRREAAQNSAWQDLYGLGSSDYQYGHWEQWAKDQQLAESDDASEWRYYPTDADEDVFLGPYQHDADEAPLFETPIAHWEPISLAGETYRGGFEGLRILED